MTSPFHRITDLLPAPFDWVAIPAGDVNLSDAGGYIWQPQTITVSTFAMARYPITVAQYQAFVEAAYDDAQWWDYSDDAREWQLENPHPVALAYGEDDYPRTHVTWYEAVAFCQWLSAMTGEALRLPTEAEWQHAAHGDDGRVYPWGNDWAANRCVNSVDNKHIGPASITVYPGDTPYGVVGLAGNVYEWCSTDWSNGSDDLKRGDTRVIRGGSWFNDNTKLFRATARSSWNPHLPSDLIGFRIVRDTNHRS
jgi:formylglycine-generating enzyme required for sulfatase activity